MKCRRKRIIEQGYRRRLHGRRGLKSCVKTPDHLKRLRRRLHGRRGLKFSSCGSSRGRCRRRLHGRRGLKYTPLYHSWSRRQSPPSRAAWIEILQYIIWCSLFGSPPSRAAWIEIRNASYHSPRIRSRRLHGRRGLKSCRAGQRLRRWRRRLHGRRGLKSKSLYQV